MLGTGLHEKSTARRHLWDPQCSCLSTLREGHSPQRCERHCQHDSVFCIPRCSVVRPPGCSRYLGVGRGLLFGRKTAQQPSQLCLRNEARRGCLSRKDNVGSLRSSVPASAARTSARCTVGDGHLAHVVDHWAAMVGNGPTCTGRVALVPANTATCNTTHTLVTSTLP
jgi:hypothetical protein